ncbi:phenylalanine--tRNA ligase subunit beta, partial [Fusobacterium mortiferum]|nr:phenylalanine--tRNA ligase subunit beta [Fusobacterium mortiferum]
NVAEGQIVPVAMVGAHLPNGMKISKGKLRGVVSNGMLCSAQELKLDLEKLPPEQKTGIFILPSDTPVGIPAKEVLGLNDVVLEFELTAN